MDAVILAIESKLTTVSTRSDTYDICIIRKHEIRSPSIPNPLQNAIKPFQKSLDLNLYTKFPFANPLIHPNRSK